MTKQTKELTKRFRKVAWGRLYWRLHNMSMRRFDSDDVCIVKRGMATTHYKTLDAFIEHLESVEHEIAKRNEAVQSE